MVVHWGEIGAILGGMAAMATIIPFIVKVLVKPVITDEINKLEHSIDKRWQEHLRMDHGYGYRGPRPKPTLHFKENDNG